VNYHRRSSGVILQKRPLDGQTRTATTFQPGPFVNFSVLADLHLTWFGTMENGWAEPMRRQRWFKADPVFDAELTRRFSGLPEELAQNPLPANVTSNDVLCLILALDQLPRHLYRGTSRAFGFDTPARDLAGFIIDTRLDQSLRIDERAFAYMPFLHSEDLEDQKRSVQLFTALRDNTPKGLRHLSGAFLRSAHRHYDTIKQFGRFPHRDQNADRTPHVQSTPAR
jgi:uncharacterized protein (DUF924 family)